VARAATETEKSFEKHEIRVISIYATRWRHRRTALEEPRLALGRLLPLGRLEEFHDLFREQLPGVLYCKELSSAELKFNPRRARGARKDFPAPAPQDGPGEGVTISTAGIWLFVLPSDQVVAALDLKYRSAPLDRDPGPTVTVLERCAYAEFQLGEDTLVQHVARLAEKVGAEQLDGSSGLPPERHQIVFASRLDGHEPPNGEIVKRILYRIDPPIRPEFMDIEEPHDLNQDSRTRGAVTQYTSLLYGHPDYIENSVFLTTVQAVGTAARFRQIWHKAHGQVRDFRYERQEPESGKQRREDMEKLVDELGNLELDLSFSVETSADLGLLIPSLRIESFHRALYAAMELRDRADTVSRMFARLDSSIESELTAIDIRERNAASRKSTNRDWAISLLTLAGVPLGFLLAFFGINASQVDSAQSMFDLRHYAWAYVLAAVLAGVPAIALLWPLLRDRWHVKRQDRQRRDRRDRPQPVG
jgi:hypothetical protein